MDDPKQTAKIKRLQADLRSLKRKRDERLGRLVRKNHPALAALLEATPPETLHKPD